MLSINTNTFCFPGLNTRFENGGSLLHLSCIAKNYEAVTYICEHGGDKQITDKQGTVKYFEFSFM